MAKEKPINRDSLTASEKLLFTSLNERIKSEHKEELKGITNIFDRVKKAMRNDPSFANIALSEFDKNGIQMTKTHNGFSIYRTVKADRKEQADEARKELLEGKSVEEKEEQEHEPEQLSESEEFGDVEVSLPNMENADAKEQKAKTSPQKHVDPESLVQQKVDDDSELKISLAQHMAIVNKHKAEYSALTDAMSDLHAQIEAKEEKMKLYEATAQKATEGIAKEDYEALNTKYQNLKAEYKELTTEGRKIIAENERLKSNVPAPAPVAEGEDPRIKEIQERYQKETEAQVKKMQELESMAKTHMQRHQEEIQVLKQQLAEKQSQNEIKVEAQAVPADAVPQVIQQQPKQQQGVPVANANGSTIIIQPATFSNNILDVVESQLKDQQATKTQLRLGRNPNIRKTMYPIHMNQILNSLKPKTQRKDLVNVHTKISKPDWHNLSLVDPFR